MIRKGTKFKCKKEITNVIGKPLFNKGEVYEVIWINNESVKTLVTLNHILYANEYMEYELEWVIKNFTQL